MLCLSAAGTKPLKLGLRKSNAYPRGLRRMWQMLEMAKIFTYVIWILYRTLEEVWDTNFHFFIKLFICDYKNVLFTK
jgi:hypothetical protein